MYQIRQLIDLLNEDGRISTALPETSDSFAECLTKDTADWLFIVSTALSFEGQEGGLSHDVLGFRSVFELTDGIVQKFLFAIEHVFHQLRTQFIDSIEDELLRRAIDNVRWSWWDRRNFFERHMHYISILAEEVIRDVHWNTQTILDEDDEEHNVESKKFADGAIRALKESLIITAFDILNQADYQYDHAYKMDSSDVSILYNLFDLYRHSISVAEIDPIKFEKSLQYRTKFDEYPLDCLLGPYHELHDRFPTFSIRHDCDYPLVDMLSHLSPPVLSRILLNVFPNPVNPDGATFLHIFAVQHNLAFLELFPHCSELWFSYDHEGYTPMGLFTVTIGWIVCPTLCDHTSYRDHCRCTLDVIFIVVSRNSDYFALLALK